MRCENWEGKVEQVPTRIPFLECSQVRAGPRRCLQKIWEVEAKQPQEGRCAGSDVDETRVEKPGGAQPARLCPAPRAAL